MNYFAHVYKLESSGTWLADLEQLVTRELKYLNKIRQIYFSSTKELYSSFRSSRNSSNASEERSLFDIFNKLALIEKINCGVHLLNLKCEKTHNAEFRQKSTRQKLDASCKLPVANSIGNWNPKLAANSQLPVANSKIYNYL